MISFTLCAKGGNRSLDFQPEALVIAGWTGRDRDLVQDHIRELEALGVPPPSAVPMFYRAARRVLATHGSVEVAGTGSTGEVECVLLATREGLAVGVGSDHTDRQLERRSVTLAKQICGKPIADELWLFEEVADHWDDLMLRSHATIRGERRLYQEGAVAALRPPADLMTAYTGAASLPAGTVMFCGTLPVRGSIEFADRFEMELRDPVLGRSIRHAYDVIGLPINE